MIDDSMPPVPRESGDAPPPGERSRAAAGDDDAAATPLVSIVMPAYNSERFLAEAIESILAQTFTAFELLVLDDGSTDGTADIARSYAEKDARVVFYPRSENWGVSRTTNFGISEARAPLIGRLDADDVALADRLERQVAYLRDHPEVVVVGSNAVHISETGERLGLSIAGPQSLDEFHRMHRAGEVTMVLQGTALFRRDVFYEAGGFDERFAAAMDVELFSRMSQYGAVVSIPEPLILYRLHPGSNVAARFYLGRTVHRFVEYRSRELAAGRVPIGYDDFMDAERSAPWHRRARITMVDYAQAHYRMVGVSIAGGRSVQAVGHLVRAVAADPGFVIGRVWRRRLSPRARARLRSAGE